MQVGVSNRVLACKTVNVPIWGDLPMNIMMPVDGNDRRENFRHVLNKGGGGINRFRVQVYFLC